MDRIVATAFSSLLKPCPSATHCGLSRLISGTAISQGERLCLVSMEDELRSMIDGGLQRNVRRKCASPLPSLVSGALRRLRRPNRRASCLERGCSSECPLPRGPSRYCSITTRREKQQGWDSMSSSRESSQRGEGLTYRDSGKSRLLLSEESPTNSAILPTRGRGPGSSLSSQASGIRTAAEMPTIELPICLPHAITLLH
ncbi:hypothetical protein OH77DRAFT_116749 [Trametes cingulata]|nr:hypothetical protein OH77DRAFT_116749 [Trametes cingulata]